MISSQWQILYIILIIITTFAMSILMLYALRRRHMPGAWCFFGFMLPISFWTVNVGVMALASPETGLFWLRLKYVWIAMAPVMLLLFILDYTSRHAYLNRRLLIGLLIIPSVTQIMVWTNQHHGFMLRDLQFAQVGILTYISVITFGPYYWIHTGYSYILSLLSIVLVVITILRGSYLYRRQGILLVTGILTTFIGNVLLIAKIVPRELDPMPFALLLTSVLLGWSVFRFHMLDLAPVARNIFVDTIPDCMLAIDSQDRIIDMNKPMLTMLGLQQSHVIGLPVTEVLQPWQHLVGHLHDRTSIEVEISLNVRDFDLFIIPLTDRQANVRGRLIVLHDITQQKQLEKEREELILTLQDALSEVKKLSGLLPICAGCKRIRDEHGSWHQIELYIRNHSEAEFSHGICPDCISKLYPDL